MADLARPAVPAVSENAVRHKSRTDSNVTGDIKECVAAARLPGALVSRRVSLRIDIVHHFDVDAKNAGRLHAAPAEVGCDEDGAGRDVNEAGNSQDGPDHGGLILRT